MKIVIDGNIGSGKTTQTNFLDPKGFKVRWEPIEEWPLELYYSDPERWGFLFQMLILQTLKTQKGFMIYERSPLSSKEVFWKIMKKTPLEDQVYQKEYESHGWLPDIYIYIKKSPELCHEHLKSRTQDGDSSVTLEYLKQLDEHYSVMIEKIKTQIEVHIIDGNQSKQDVHNKIFQIIRTKQNEYNIQM